MRTRQHLINKIPKTPLIAGLMLLLGDAGYGNPKTIRIATNEYPPYTTKSDKNLGFAAHIVSEAFRLQGIKATYGFFPDKRSYMLAKTGEFDATLLWAMREERKAHFHYGDWVTPADEEVFFYLKGKDFPWDPVAQDYTRIRGKVVGAIIGNNYGARFQTAEKKKIMEVIRVTKLSQSLKMLLNSRLDMIISPRRVGLISLKKHFPARMHRFAVKTAIQEKTEYDYLLISKKSKHAAFFLAAMNKGLRILKDSGRYRKIVDQYFPAPGKEGNKPGSQNTLHGF